MEFPPNPYSKSSVIKVYPVKPQRGCLSLLFENVKPKRNVNNLGIKTKLTLVRSISHYIIKMYKSSYC